MGNKLQQLQQRHSKVVQDLNEKTEQLQLDLNKLEGSSKAHLQELRECSVVEEEYKLKVCFKVYFN